MGEVIAFPPRRRSAGAASRPPQVVFEDRGWHILALPNAGRFLAVSATCRRGIEIGRFDPQAGPTGGSAVAILLRAAADESLSRCAVAWLNSPQGPRTAILGVSIVAAGGRFRFWRDAIVEMAVIGGHKLVRLSDGSVAIARDPAPIPLLDPFAARVRHRRRPAFLRLPAEMRAAVLRWTDPLGQFTALLAPAPPS
ncbi:MAG: hypothetical protein ACREFK_01965 [Stellaceae bacterium]